MWLKKNNNLTAVNIKNAINIEKIENPQSTLYPHCLEIFYSKNHSMILTFHTEKERDAEFDMITKKRWFDW
jgi:hypothetical protein